MYYARIIITIIGISKVYTHFDVNSTLFCYYTRIAYFFLEKEVFC